MPRGIAPLGIASVITRPSSQEVAAYRAHVDAEVEKLIAEAPADRMREILRILEIGLNHEQQHQELMLTDILHVFAQNPDFPAYDPAWRMPHAGANKDSGFLDVAEGIRTIGHQNKGFCFDNEQPPHRALVGRVSVARGLVTNGDWLEFIADGGYERPELWLSDGWATVVAEGPNATVLQHEIDHLDGVLMLDRTDRDSRKAALRALREAALGV